MDTRTDIPARHGPMIVVVGLGPIGAGVGAALAERGERVFGIDPDAARASDWASQTGMPVAGGLDDGPDRESVDLVVVAVRTADQVRSVLDDLPVGEGTVFVLTTLAVTDASALARSPHRIVEAPVSGGARAARDGALTMFLHAREPLAPAAQRFVEGVTGKVFPFGSPGLPAVAKLANNTLAGYNAFALAGMADVAAGAGLDRATFHAVVSASSGQSWMGDHFAEFQPDLLFKDVALLQRDIGELPVIHVTGAGGENEIADARRRLAAT